MWGGFFDSNFKYVCGILAKIINMDPKFVIFRLRNIYLGAKIINMDLKSAFQDYKNGSCFMLQWTISATVTVGSFVRMAHMWYTHLNY